MKFSKFIQTGNVKFAAAAAFIGFPMIGLLIFNNQALAWARPKLLEIRESITGKPDMLHRKIDAALRGDAIPKESFSSSSSTSPLPTNYGNSAIANNDGNMFSSINQYQRQQQQQTSSSSSSSGTSLKER